MSIVLRPKMPEAIEGQQVERKVLGRSLRELIAHKGDRLRTLSLMFHDASSERSVLAQQFARYAMQIAPSNSDELLGDETYRLLGGISEEDWDSLAAGRPASISQLAVTDEMRALLVSESRKVIGIQPVSDIQHHAIELFDIGPVGAAIVSVRKVQYDVIRSQHSGRSVAPWQYLARFAALGPLAVTRLPDRSNTPIGTQDSFEQRIGLDTLFQLGSQAQQIITIDLPHGQRMEIVWSSEIRGEGSLVTYPDLPQRLRDQIWKDAVTYQTRAISSSSKRSTARAKGSSAVNNNRIICGRGEPHRLQ